MCQWQRPINSIVDVKFEELEDVDGGEMGEKPYVWKGEGAGGNFKCRGKEVGIKLSNVDRGCKHTWQTCENRVNDLNKC